VFTLDGQISAFHFGIGSGSSSFESSGFVGNGTIEGLLETMTEFNMNDIRSLGELVVVSVLSFDRLERGDTANYTCTATNMLPQTTTLTALSPSIPLVVLGKQIHIGLEWFAIPSDVVNQLPFSVIPTCLYDCHLITV